MTPLELGRLVMNYIVDGDFSTVWFLMSLGADPSEAYDGAYRNPLHSASAEGGEELCALLIDRGVDINVPDINDRTALDYAELFSLDAIQSLLVEHGALRYNNADR